MRPLIINNHEKTESVYQESIKYLETNDLLYNDIGNFIWAYNQIGDLIPQTTENFWSGHFFPFSESYYELENSFQFCLQGFYRHSVSALRTVLELAVIGLYFNKDERGHIDIQEWIHSKDPTPFYKKCIKELFKDEYYQQADKHLNMFYEVKNLYDSLSDFVHVRGYKFSTSGRSLSNFNNFNENALVEYVQFMKPLVTNTITMILLKYPIGMQNLPLTEKFYLNSPMGGFLDDSSQHAIFAVLDDKHKDILYQISNNDSTVQEIVQRINNLPDLTDEEVQKQNEEYDKWMKDPRNQDTNS